jgi:RNA polymerase-binding transcription factor DksA
MTGRVCEKCGEPITLKDLQAVKVFGQGMQYYHKDHYKLA